MTPVAVCFTPDAEELARIQAAVSKARPTLPMVLAVVLAVMFLVQGGMSLATHRPHFFWQFGYFQILLGLSYIPITWRTQSSVLVSAKPSVEVALTIDDAGITYTEPHAKRIPWRGVSAVRDVGEAFIVLKTLGRPVPILKRALPDGGTALWTSLQETLTSDRYLIRGSASRYTITNTAAQR